MNTHPPKWALRFLRWFCRTDLVDAVEGDLVELFERRVERLGVIRARMLFIFNVLMFFKPFAMKRRSDNKALNALEMQVLNFRYAIRNLANSRMYSLINVLSLAIGLTACGLLVSFISEELSYDKFHSKGDRTYRFGYQLENENQPTRQLAWVSALVGPKVVEAYPEVESMVRIRNCQGTMVAPNNEVFLEDGGFFAGSSFFDIFSFKILTGHGQTALDEPNELVLTESMARKYFGDQDPIGKTLELRMRDTLHLQVTAIIADVPAESHFAFDYLISHKTREQLYPHIHGWFALGTHTYFRLKENVNASLFEQKVENIVMDNYGEEAREIGFVIKVFTQPLWDIHLKSDLGNEITSNGNIQYVYIAGGIAGIIFLISIFNFVNLSFARSAKFVKQVGLRRVLGASKHQLIHQFMTETVLLVLISFVLSSLLAYTLLPFFETVVSRNLGVQWAGWYSLTTIGMLVLMVGFLAGLLPTIRILSLKTISSLKGKFNIGNGKKFANQSLIVVQFAMATLLICSVLIINGQLNYMLKSSLGFDHEQVAIIDLWNNRQARQNTSILKEELLKSPNISVVTASNSIPGERLLNRVGYPNGDQSQSKVMFSLLAQADFLKLYGLEVVSGRNISTEMTTDQTHAFLINETGVKEFGWDNKEAVGQDFQWGSRAGKIVGVVKDFHYYSLHQQIPPMIILPAEGGVGFLSVKINGNVAGSVDFIADTWEALYPDQVFNLSFLDDRFNKQYLLENQLSKIITLFTVVAILIACSGLFSLSAFHVEQRIKEIGIHKLLGASIPDVLYIVSKFFLGLVTLSILMALPLTYLLTQRWLDDFAFRIKLGPLFFIIAALVSFLIAVLTVGIQSLRAAKLNPAENLRYE